MIAAIGADDGLHPDFGSGRYEGQPIGIPFDVVSRRTRRSRVSFAYADESNRVRYPIPENVHIEGGDGDRHALLLDRDACKLYELFALERSGGAWRAGSGAVWSLRSNRLRPRGWTSADAAGLPILPGLARFDEVRRGRIDHALRFTVSRTRRAFVYPARHFASSLSDPRLPRMGERFRLRSGFDISGYPRQARVVAPGAEDLRDDRGRQRLGLVHQRGAVVGVGQRRAAPPGDLSGADFEVVRDRVASRRCAGSRGAGAGNVEDRRGRPGGRAALPVGGGLVGVIVARGDPAARRRGRRRRDARSSSSPPSSGPVRTAPSCGARRTRNRSSSISSGS